MFADITTNGGEHYEKLVFTIEGGYLKTAQEVPDYILEGLVTAYKSYLAQEEMLSTSTQPAAPRVTQRKAMPQSQWPSGGSYGENNYGAGSFGGGFGRNKKNPFGGF